MKTETDEELRLARAFVCFTGMRTGFHSYGQLLQVDATCKTNRFNMPLLVFCGVHGDGQTAVFAYALIRVENQYNVHWCFEQLKNCVGEIAWNNCKTVMTDGAEIYSTIIAEIVPQAKHVRCIWHIEQDMAKALRDRVPYEAFKTQWEEATKVKSESHFLELWRLLRKKYSEGAGKVLDKQFEYKQKFARCYVDQYLTLGCYSTQRTESQNRVSNVLH
jgi:hypothetical protein